MMPTRLGLPALLAATCASLLSPSAHSDEARVVLPLLSAEQISSGCTSTIAEMRQRAKSLEEMSAASARDPKTLLARWDALQIAQEDFMGPTELYGEVSPDKQVRDAVEPCVVEFSKFSSELYQNERLYRMFKGLIVSDPIDRKMQRDILWGFEDTGVSLPAKKRGRMKAILTELEALSQEFSRNIRDNNERLAFTAAELQGLPTDYLAKAKRDDQGNYLLGFAYPEFIPFMENADDAAARKRYQSAYNNRGTPRNLAILKQAIALRKEMAGLFGLSNYADFVIRRRMAGSSRAVNKFLAEVRVAVSAGEKKEIEELRAFRANATKQPLAGTEMNRWDVPYWQNKLKKARFDLNPNELRKYFPADAAIAWIMHISSVQYGIEFRRVDVPVWHPEVEYYDVIDTKTQRRIAGIYLDMFPRDGKFSHAAAAGVRHASTATGRTPITVLMANFDRAGFDDEEMRTLAHEFGHVLHGVLSRTRYASQSGTSVERDFVEAPSQMFEEWARDLDTLKLVAQFCKSPCPSVDAPLVAKMTAMYNYGRAIRYARQLLYASFDMSLHSATPQDPMAAWAKMEGASPLGYVPGTQFPGSFGHLMGGYGAGYYGYMWSEVLALDMLSAFGGKLINPQVGARYLDKILSRGGERTGMEMVRDFLGREPSNQAFFAEIAGKRLN